jgi:acetyl esterase/lipase
MNRIAAFAFVFLGTVVAVAQEPKNPNLPTDAKTFLNLSYGTHDRHKLDIAVPAGPGPHPLIVWIHGGGWEMGSKGGFGPATVHQVARGYAVAGINYRFSQHATFPAQIHDVKNAIRFLKANAKKYGIDPDRIGVIGASAGGHLATLLGTSNGVKELDAPNADPAATKVACVIDLFGPADLLRLSPPGSPENPVTRLLGGDSGKHRDLAKLGSPQTHADESDPPTLIIHGDKDLLVPLSQSEELVAAFKKSGIDVELIVVKGGGHGLRFFNADVNRAMNAFFDKHLKAR